jgi:hypothetical protein
MPQKFNLKFNQKSTTRCTEEDHFSYSSNGEDERAIELGDYFSDDEEDDTGDRQDLKSESILWSPTKFNKTEEKSPLSHAALSEWNPVISGLETFEDHSEAKLNHISGLLEETQLGFSTWQPFIPLEHVFQNSAAQSQPSDFSSQASSSQGPTRIPISTIATSTKLTLLPMTQISPRQETSLSPPKDWLSSRPATKSFTNSWTKPWLESTKICNGIQNWRTESPDHQEQSK